MDSEIINEDSLFETLMINIPTLKEPGILSGKAGCLLFALIYAKKKKIVWAEKIVLKILEDIIESFPLKAGYSLTDGATGVAWLIHFLETNNFISADTDALLEDFEAILLNQLEEYKKGKSLDINTAIGLGWYLYWRFSRRSNSTVPEDLKNCLFLWFKVFYQLLNSHKRLSHWQLMKITCLMDKIRVYDSFENHQHEVINILKNINVKQNKTALLYELLINTSIDNSKDIIISSKSLKNWDLLRNSLLPSDMISTKRRKSLSNLIEQRLTEWKSDQKVYRIYKMPRDYSLKSGLSGLLLARYSNSVNTAAIPKDLIL